LLSFIHRDIKAEYIFYEINMHEEKLFQDTTVESSNPKDNNAFGGTAFLGHTDMFGEQWLYSRAEISALSELFEKHIIEATLHIPELSNLGAPLSANRVSARFCSFGSNWNNKITASAKMSDIKLDNGYYSIDVSDLMINKINDRLIKSEGLIINRKAGHTGFSVVSTGDSFYAPQILEIKFK
ncbi:MAG: hypothetical protein U0K93_08115, partial [Acutalibacteraceae bacterium]|nr:hypothetical protein [Acutalibacteraceae bacterium]